MKNIHILPTDKASRLLYNSTLKSFCIQKEIDGMFINDGKVSGANFWGLEKALNNGFQPHNIYITSDEEIKGYWEVIFDIRNNKVVKWEHPIAAITPYYKKIILTTDKDLDGVQSIDDEFLEWFVKNSSCETVEVEKICNNCEEINCIHAVCSSQIALKKGVTYKIIIPKEEPKSLNTCTGHDEEGNPLNYQGNILPLKEESKQETRKNRLLEELVEDIKNQQSFLRSVKKNPQLYYYKFGNCIYERLYNNSNCFEMEDPYGGKSSKMEKELINLKAKKLYYD